MGDLKDWDRRPLPSEERCRLWYEQGGTWHMTTNTTDGAFCMARGVRSGYPSDADKPLWRPWLKGEPAGWDATFYPMTHPPIPEGWEKVGEWAWESGGVSAKAFVIKTYDNDAGILHSGDGFSVGVRRVPPPADWGDVPSGVWMHANGGLYGCMCVRRGDGTICGTVSHKDGEWFFKPVAASSERGAHRSLPAAIVALTGRRE